MLGITPGVRGVRGVASIPVVPIVSGARFDGGLLPSGGLDSGVAELAPLPVPANPTDGEPTGAPAARAPDDVTMRTGMTRRGGVGDVTEVRCGSTSPLGG